MRSCRSLLSTEACSLHTVIGYSIILIFLILLYSLTEGNQSITAVTVDFELTRNALKEKTRSDKKQETRMSSLSTSFVKVMQLMLKRFTK